MEHSHEEQEHIEVTEVVEVVTQDVEGSDHEDE